MTELSYLPLEVRQLVVEAAIAAPNYGLMPQAKALLSVLCIMKLDDETYALTKAMVCFGLYRPRAALAALKNRNSEKAQALRRVIKEYLEAMASKKGASAT